jgi:hypothetical protein
MAASSEKDTEQLILGIVLGGGTAALFLIGLLTLVFA